MPKLRMRFFQSGTQNFVCYTQTPHCEGFFDLSRLGLLVGFLVVASIVSGCSVGLDQRILKPGSTLRDCLECPDMVVIPPGAFMMGSSHEQQRWALMHDYDEEFVVREGPQHLVTIPKPFAVGRFEVTRGQYEAFYRQTKHQHCESCGVGDGDGISQQVGYSWVDPSFEQTNEHPVVCVSWLDAQAFIRWLNGKALTKDNPYRLLTEAEWEYAARAGNSAKWSCGDDLNCLEEVAWYRFNGGIGTKPVGTKKPNAFGLHDMHGNAFELVQDCIKDDYASARDDGQAWADPKEDEECKRGFRGGSWASGELPTRSANRGAINPDEGVAIIVFRVARSLDGDR
jgi:formylglycine-generating enzyme required for sulfatase activity